MATKSDILKQSILDLLLQQSKGLEITEITDHHELRELISEFNQWKSHLVKVSERMGGEIVFPNSRLSVRHIGTIFEKGESPEVILEDYPYLTSKDIQFSYLYVKEIRQ